METNTNKLEEMMEFRGVIKEFQALMMNYECAMLEIKTKLDVLNAELSVKDSRNPFETIKTRIKKPVSIINKMKKDGVEITLANIESHLNDVAGIRVVCSFPDDIYKLANYLEAQDDIKVIARKDYIANPKPSGYRSLHLIVEVPIFLTTEKKNMRVEVQFRTIAMDFWASLEHKLKYKTDVVNADTISGELQFCAELINQLDCKMQQIREKIDME
jgi:putative GTP pyrophosphokinase